MISFKCKFKEDECMLRALSNTHRYVFSRFWTHKPIFLAHSVTLKCNCRCKICDTWRKKHNTDEMTTHEIFRMLDEARKLNFVAYIALGGEPLIRPDILDILQHAHDLGFYTSMITNGVHLSAKAEEIAKVVDLTWISLDYHSDYHDKMRGRKGTFKRSVDGIIKLRRAGGRIAINCVLSRLNMDVVGEMSEFARRLGVKLAFDPMEVFLESTKEYALTHSERRHLFSEIREFKKQGYPILNSHEFIEHLISRIKYSCAQPKIFIRVSEDGKIKPFWCKKTSTVLGDLRKQSLGEVLYSNSFEGFTEIANGCNLCNNSSTVEASIFYSARRFLMSHYKWENPYLKFILDYAL